MKPHIFAEMLGSLRELAFHFGTAEQFRDRASTLLQQYIQVDGGIPADRVPGEGMVAEAVEARRVAVPERAAWLTIDEIAAVIEEGAADYRMTTLLRSQAVHIARLIASASMDKGTRHSRAIPADRLPGEGMVAVDRQLLLDVEDALGRAEGLGPCGLGLLCQVQDTLRANQGGAEHD